MVPSNSKVIQDSTELSLYLLTIIHMTTNASNSNAIINAKLTHRFVRSLNRYINCPNLNVKVNKEHSLMSTITISAID